MANSNSTTNKTNNENNLEQVNRTLVDETAELGALAKSIAPE